MKGGQQYTQKCAGVHGKGGEFGMTRCIRPHRRTEGPAPCQACWRHPRPSSAAGRSVHRSRTSPGGEIGKRPMAFMYELSSIATERAVAGQGGLRGPVPWKRAERTSFAHAVLFLDQSLNTPLDTSPLDTHTVPIVRIFRVKPRLDTTR